MLQLREVLVPQWPFGKVSLFRTPAKGLTHLCDHVLTRPEANFWSKLIPGYRDLVDPNDDDALYRFARSLWSHHPPVEAAQHLYDGYGDLIVEAMGDAIRQGWYWAEEEEDGPTWRGLATSGVYVIWRQSHICTAMLLGYTAPPVEENAARLRRQNPLPRQHAWKYRGAQLRHDEAHYPPEPGDAQQALYHLFKKGAVRVRREYKHAARAGRVSGGGAYLGSLHLGVPDFATWQRLTSPPAPAAPLPRAFSMN